MFISRLKILLFGILLLPVSFASAQQQYQNRPKLDVPRVTLSASPASVVAGRPIRLVAQLSSGYPNIRFRFAFGDGTQSPWQTSTVATHSYSSPGKYLPFVDIGVASGSGVSRLGGSVRRPIQVTHASPGPVELYMTPANPEIGRPVTLSARTALNDPNVRYRFVFGDGSPVGGWQSSPHAKHVYRSGGAYSASVEVAVMTNRGLTPESSSRRAVTVATPVGWNRTTSAGPVRREARGSSKSAAKTYAKSSAKTSASSATSSATTKTPRPQQGSSSKPSPAGSIPAAISSPSPAQNPEATEGPAAVAATDGSNGWRWYLWLAIPLGLIALLVGGRYFMARPTIRTHADPGTASVSDAGEGPLIKNVRRDNG